MLTFNKSKDSLLIAEIPNKNKDDKLLIYYKPDPDGDLENEIDADTNQKLSLFSKYIEGDNKLSFEDIKSLKLAFKTNSTTHIPQKLTRKYEDAVRYVENSLKTYLDFEKDKLVFPIITDPSYRLFLSGLSGSGKSTVIASFLKTNRPKKKGAGIFLFSPISDDPSLKSIKNLIQQSIHEIETNLEREIEVEDFPDGSVVIFDDIESIKKPFHTKYMELRDTLLERGRSHKEGELGISTICVSHNAMNGHSTKTSIRECQYWVLFPSSNKRDVKTLLKTYGGLETQKIDDVMNIKSRWIFFKKSVPQYVIAEHSILLI